MKKEFKFYGVTAILVTVLLLFLYTQIDAFKNTIFISDSFSQYTALFLKLKNILQTGSSLFYSFQGGLGDGFLGTFFYYLCSPFNILLFFFQDIEKFTLTIILLKFIGISLTALYFFRYHFPKESPIFSIAFSILYIFISFNILYFFQLLWLDAVLALPLLLVGIDKFIKKRKFFLYTFSLFYIIVTNYYFGYMACIFSFLYFNYQTLCIYSIKKEWKKILKENFLFIGISLLAVLSTSFVLLEIIHYLPGYARTTTELFNGEPFLFQGNPFHFFHHFLMFSTHKVDFLNADDFFLYIGLLPFLLVVLYFVNPNIPKKEKVLTLLMILLLYLSVSGNYFNYLWSALSKPQFFNGRFTFLFSFFLLYIAMKSVKNLPYLSKKKYLLGALFLLIILYTFFFSTKKIVELYGNLAVFITYYLLISSIDSNKIYMPIIIITVAFMEAEANALVELNRYAFTSKEIYQEQNEIYEFATNFIQEKDKSPFYRIETNKTDPYNGPIFYQYNGIDVFLSTISDKMANFFFDIGYGSGSTKKNTISYYSGNEIMDSLLGIKYHIFIDGDNVPDSYQFLTEKEIQNKKITVYENPNALSLGFMTNSEIKSIQKQPNALKYQNDILKAMTNSNLSIYQDIPLKEEEKRYYFDNIEKKKICFYTSIDSSNGYNNPTLYLNGHRLHKIEDFEIVCADPTYNDQLVLSYSNLDDEQHLGTYAAYYSPEAWEKIISNLKENQLYITEYSGDKIKGTVTVNKEKNILFTTIPYDSNWSVYVNGKKIKTIKILDFLLGVELEEGTFDIEFRYYPKQFYLGIIISLTSFITLIFIKRKWFSL